MYQLAHDLITLRIIGTSDLIPYIQNRTFAHPIHGCHDIKHPAAGWIGFFDGESLSVRGAEPVSELLHSAMLSDFRRFDNSREPGPCKMFFFRFPERLERDGRTISCMVTIHHL